MRKSLGHRAFPPPAGSPGRPLTLILMCSNPDHAPRSTTRWSIPLSCGPLGGRQCAEALVLDPPHHAFRPPEHLLARFRQVDPMRPAILRVGLPPHQPATLQLVEQRHHRRAVDADRRAELMLRRPARNGRSSPAPPRASPACPSAPTPARSVARNRCAAIASRKPNASQAGPLLRSSGCSSDSSGSTPLAHLARTPSDPSQSSAAGSRLLIQFIYLPG